MLNHDDNPQPVSLPVSLPISLSASEARVTPEELAAAITRMDASKDVNDRQTDGTFAIGDVVEQLGLNATPEEILLEVESGRRTEFLLRGTRMTVKQRSGVMLAAGVLIASFIAMQIGSVIVSSPISDTDVSRAAAVPHFVPAATDLHRILVNPDLLVGDASGKLVLLSEVGDGQPVHCTYNNGRFQRYSIDSTFATWTLVKYNGRLYVRGWLLKMSPKVLQSEGADVSAVNSSEFTVPITLPLKGVSILKGASGDTEFHAQSIHLDRHAYEKWNP